MVSNSLSRYLNRPFLIFILSCLASLVFFVSVSQPFFDFALAEWDTANAHYPSFAWSLGKIPNIDFVHGYTGVHAWMFSIFYGENRFLFSEFNQFGYLLTFLNSCAVGLLVMVLCRTAGIAMIFMLLTFSLNISTPTATPGFGSSALASIGFVTFFLPLYFQKLGSPKAIGWTTLGTAGCFLVGLSLGMKQSGLFASIGLFQVIMVLASTKFDKSKFWVLFKYVAIALPVVGFLLIRRPDFSGPSFFNAFAIVPWILSTILALKMIPVKSTGLEASKVQIPLVSCLVFCLALGIGAASFLFAYPTASWASVIFETFVHIPKLIDRHEVAVTPAWLISSWPYLITFGIAVLLSLFIEMKVHFHLNERSWPEALKFAIWIPIATISFIIVQHIWRSPSGVEAIALARFISPLTHDLYLWPSIVGCFLLVLMIYKDNWFTHWEKLLLIFSGSFSASMYPYPGNSRYCIIALSLYLFVPLMAMARNFDVYMPGRKLSFFKTWTCCLIASASFGSSVFWLKSFGRDWLARSQEFAFSDGIVIKAPPYNFPFLKLADWLSQNAHPDSTVAGYPNFGLSLLFSKRVSFTRQPNFIGNRTDFDQLIGQVQNGKGPDYYLISKKLYPYPLNFPYFEPPDELIAGLIAARYLEVFKVDLNSGGDALLIYHKTR